ncbi:MAG: hypothetical protein KGI78_00745 [Patescibacteria group bacterium]|nr:hypothetical protein [Patescibacteria group bacterium]MDE1944681.1 hypothetical protein [Patescibacteria group bacterium]MDE2057367.1 hypothetical protein [Patescibacteria group bacterium]
MPNVDALRLVLMSGLPVSAKAVAFVHPAFGIRAQYGVVQMWFIILNALLLGVNAALISSFIAARFFVPGRQIASSFGAFVAATVGLGCASCGAALGSFLVALFGSGSSVLVPDIGLLLNMCASLAYVGSIALIIAQMRKPAVC